MGSGFYKKYRHKDSLEFRSRANLLAKRMGEDNFYKMSQSPEAVAKFRARVARDVYFMRLNGTYDD